MSTSGDDANRSLKTEQEKKVQGNKYEEIKTTKRQFRNNQEKKQRCQ